MAAGNFCFFWEKGKYRGKSHLFEFLKIYLEGRGVLAWANWKLKLIEIHNIYPCHKMASLHNECVKQVEKK